MMSCPGKRSIVLFLHALIARGQEYEDNGGLEKCDLLGLPHNNTGANGINTKWRSELKICAVKQP